MMIALILRSVSGQLGAKVWIAMLSGLRPKLDPRGGRPEQNTSWPSSVRAGLPPGLLGLKGWLAQEGAGYSPMSFKFAVPFGRRCFAAFRACGYLLAQKDAPYGLGGFTA